MEEFWVGVIVGEVKIENCINKGQVVSNDSNSYAGGIIGTAGNSSPKTIISNCYNIGRISSTTKGGILSYYYNGTLDIKNNYWVNTSEVSYGRATEKSNINAEPKSETELQNLTTTLGDAYVNDEKIKIKDETGLEKEVWKYNNGYPVLKWQLRN